MGWNPNFYIVFPYSLAYQINWPEDWKYQCVDNIPKMLKEVLNVSTIGSEIKLIWNDYHRDVMIKKNGITYEQLDDYLKSDCSMLSFRSEGTIERAVKALKRMGAEDFVCVSSYRDVILQQAFYRHNKKFNSNSMNEVSTFKKEERICPYCGQTVMIYIGPPILDSEEECPHCKKLFLCHVDIEYSTFVQDKDKE